MYVFWGAKHLKHCGSFSKSVSPQPTEINPKFNLQMKTEKKSTKGEKGERVQLLKTNFLFLREKLCESNKILKNK